MPEVDKEIINLKTYQDKDRIIRQLTEMLAIAAVKYNGGVFEYERKDDDLITNCTHRFTGDNNKQIFKVTREGKY